MNFSTPLTIIFQEKNLKNRARVGIMGQSKNNVILNLDVELKVNKVRCSKKVQKEFHSLTKACSSNTLHNLLLKPNHKDFRSSD